MCGSDKDEAFFFFKPCKIFAEKNLLQETIHISITEQVLIFLQIIGFNMRFRTMGGRLYRSNETIHQYFRAVLWAILSLYKYVVKLFDSDTP